MGIWSFFIKRRKQPSVLDRVVFSPPSLDLDPGEVGTVDVSGLDAQGRLVPVTIKRVIAPDGVVFSFTATRITATAAAVGPLNDLDLQVDVEV